MLISQVSLSWESIILIVTGIATFIGFCIHAYWRQSELEIQMEARLSKLEQKVDDLDCNNCPPKKKG